MRAFVPGPMACIVDKLIEARLGYSILDYQAQGAETVRFISETDLASYCKNGPTLLPGFKHGKGTAGFVRNAQALGLLAKAEQRESGQPVVAVLFRDSDGRAHAPVKRWADKVESMERGFALAEFDAGVPMVPRPKSEAWLLCGLKSPPYECCGVLEESPGNDDSPNSLKVRLDELMGHESAAKDQSEWIKSGKIDPQRIEMPSFTRFRAALEAALDCSMSGITG